jgi:hypothetical protein
MAIKVFSVYKAAFLILKLLYMASFFNLSKDFGWDRAAEVVLHTPMA